MQSSFSIKTNGEEDAMQNRRKRSSIFLSHSSSDKRFAERLGKRLANWGVTVWIDKAEIKVGDLLLEKIAEGIEHMDYLGAILSSTSLSSNWVQKELQMAMTMEIKQKRIKVIPILHSDCDIPAFLQDKVYADFRNRSMFQHSLLKLLDVLVPEGFREQILNVVRRAIQAEFSAYKALPRIELQELDKYFTKTGSARKRIEHVLRHRRKKRCVINNPWNPSTCELLDIKLRRLEDNRAIVVTEEYVYLKWFDLGRSLYEYIYNERNKQTYILVREKGGKWKVDVNVYPPPKQRRRKYWMVGMKETR
jgi:hypothetical protein